MKWDDLQPPGRRLLGEELVEELNRQRDMLTVATASHPPLAELTAGFRALSSQIEVYSAIATELARARQPWLELCNLNRDMSQIGLVAEPAALVAARARMSQDFLEDQLGVFRRVAAGLDDATKLYLEPPLSLSTVAVEVLFETTESLFGSFVDLSNDIAALGRVQTHPVVFDVPPLRVAAQKRLVERPTRQMDGTDSAEEGPEQELLR